jgi:hypothetical protein
MPWVRGSKIGSAGSSYATLDAAVDTGAMSPQHTPRARSRSSFPVLQLRWPYYLGALASLMFGLSLLLALIAVHLPAKTAVVAGVFGGAFASALIGNAWFGVLCNGQGSAVPIIGSFPLPLAVACLERGSYDMKTTAAIVVGSLAAFSWSHVAAPCDAFLRGLAAVSAMLWSFMFVAVVKQWDMPSAFHALSLVALAVTSVCVGLSFLQLRPEPPRQDDDSSEKLLSGVARPPSGSADSANSAD